MQPARLVDRRHRHTPKSTPSGGPRAPGEAKHRKTITLSACDYFSTLFEEFRQVNPSKQIAHRCRDTSSRALRYRGTALLRSRKIAQATFRDRSLVPRKDATGNELGVPVKKTAANYGYLTESSIRLNWPSRGREDFHTVLAPSFCGSRQKRNFSLLIQRAFPPVHNPRHGTDLQGLVQQSDAEVVDGDVLR